MRVVASDGAGWNVMKKRGRKGMWREREQVKGQKAAQTDNSC
jgi:hypothetical protein